MDDSRCDCMLYISLRRDSVGMQEKKTAVSDPSRDMEAIKNLASVVPEIDGEKVV